VYGETKQDGREYVWIIIGHRSGAIDRVARVVETVSSGCGEIWTGSCIPDYVGCREEAKLPSLLPAK
jgi:hypothetical protein